MVRNHQTQHRVAQKLEPLVVAVEPGVKAGAKFVAITFVRERNIERGQYLIG
jgi:hypothetical protein